MKTIVLATLLMLMALLGVGHTAHQSGLSLGLGLTLTQPSAAPTGGWMHNWFNPSVF